MERPKLSISTKEIIMNKKTKLIRNALYFFPQGIPLFRYAKFTLTLLIFQFSFTNANAQTCNTTNTVATTPSNDFTVHNNGTVTHKPTGLMWKVCSEGQNWNSSDGSCTGAATSHSWQQALQIPPALNTGGGFATHTDWRLPNLKELMSIVELSCYSPAINQTIFNSMPSGYSPIYWSSSPNANDSDNAWGVNFVLGSDGSHVDRCSHVHVRLVRSGQ